MGIKLLDAAGVDANIVQMMQLPVANGTFWQRIMKQAINELSAADIAQIAKYVGETEDPNDQQELHKVHGVDSFADSLIARHVIQLYPAIRLAVRKYRADIAKELVSPIWHFLWPDTTKLSLTDTMDGNVTFEQVALFKRAAELAAVLASQGDIADQTLTGVEFPLIVLERVRAILRSSGIQNLEVKNQVSSSPSEMRAEIRTICRRLDFIESRLPEIDSELAILMAKEQNLRLAGLHKELDTGPLTFEDIIAIHTLVLEAQYKGTLVDVSQTNGVQITEVLEQMRWNESTTAERRTYILLALKTATGMAQYLAFVKITAIGHERNIILAQMHSLTEEKNRLIIERVTYNG